MRKMVEIDTVVEIKVKIVRPFRKGDLCAVPLDAAVLGRVALPVPAAFAAGPAAAVRSADLAFAVRNACHVPCGALEFDTGSAFDQFQIVVIIRPGLDKLCRSDTVSFAGSVDLCDFNGPALLEVLPDKRSARFVVVKEKHALFAGPDRAVDLTRKIVGSFNCPGICVKPYFQRCSLTFSKLESGKIAAYKDIGIVAVSLDFPYRDPRTLGSGRNTGVRIICISCISRIGVIRTGQIGIRFYITVVFVTAAA